MTARRCHVVAGPSLIIRNVRLKDRAYGAFDIAITGDIITGVAPEITESGAMEIDGRGNLAIPSFVDSHSHLDKAMMIHTSSPAVEGTVSESLARSHEAQRRSSVEDVVSRATEALKWGIANGTGAIRVHCDVDFAWGLTSVEGILAVKRQFAGIVDVQVLVLPHENPLDEKLRKLVRSGMDAGADAIGGMPHFEFTPQAVVEYVDFVFRIAKDYDVDVDLHLDHNLERTSYTRATEYVLATTLREKYEDRVTLNHCGALSIYAPSHVARVIDLMKRARINFVTCPKEELIVNGMGQAPVKSIMAAGVNCAYAHNNIADMFSPYGRMDMLEAGLFAIHLGGFRRKEDADDVLDMGTINPARILNLDGYGIEEGCKAHVNVLDAPDAYEAFRRNADRLFVIRNGRVVAETRRETMLHLED